MPWIIENLGVRHVIAKHGLPLPVTSLNEHSHMIGQVGGKWHLGAKVFTFRSETFADI
jgi:hypothetical protein